MILFLALCLALLTYNIDLQFFFAPIVHCTHSYCLTHVPEIDQKLLMSTLLCGEKLHTSSQQLFFAKSALYHLIITSKAHLNLIITLLSFLFIRNNIIVTGVLLLFSFASQLQPPFVRALAFILLEKFNRKFCLNWNPVHLIILSNLCCLILFPGWINSLSLLHSVACAIAFYLAMSLSKNPIKIAAIAYFFTIPFLFGWANIHPIGLIVNIFLAPILFVSLYSLALLGFFIPTTAILFSKFVNLFESIITPFLDPIPLIQEPTHLNIIYLWIVFWILTLVLNFKNRFTS